MAECSIRYEREAVSQLAGSGAYRKRAGVFAACQIGKFVRGLHGPARRREVNPDNKHTSIHATVLW
jgi:hypothetical protein